MVWNSLAVIKSSRIWCLTLNKKPQVSLAMAHKHLRAIHFLSEVCLQWIL